VFPGVQVASSGAVSDGVDAPNVAVTNAQDYCISVIYQRGSSSSIRLKLTDVTSGNTSIGTADTSGKTVVSQVAGTLAVLSDATLTGTYRKAVLRFTPNFTGNLKITAGPNSATAGQLIVVLGAQIETGRIPTSFINAQVTRPVDKIQMTGRLAPQRGALLIEFEKPPYLPLSNENPVGIMSITPTGVVNRGFGVVINSDYSLSVIRRSDAAPSSEFLIYSNYLLDGFNKLWFMWDNTTGEAWLSLNGTPLITLGKPALWTLITGGDMRIGSHVIQGSDPTQLGAHIRSVVLFNFVEA
jgi:hypothetical protein